MQFAIYLAILVLIELSYSIVSYFLIPELTAFKSYYLIVASVLILIFVAKYIFLSLTKSIQDSKPDFWVNANLLAFAVKFILIIGLMFLLTIFAEKGAKTLIIWTAILYCFFLIADIIYDLKSSSD